MSFCSRYAEQLFDVMITGTMLAPGGKQDPSITQRAEVCVFSCEPTVEAQREHIQVSLTIKMYPSTRLNFLAFLDDDKACKAEVQVSAEVFTGRAF